MSTENDVTTAQVPATATDSSQAATANPAQLPVSAPNPMEGVQKRIDELTAKSYEKDAQLNAMFQANQQLINTLAQRTQEASQAPVPQPSFENVDPETRKFIEYQNEQQRRWMAQQQATMQAQGAQSRLNQLVLGQDPRVGQRAQAILRETLPNNPGFTAEMAMTYAYGELAPTLLDEARKGQSTAQFRAAGQAQTIAGQTPPPSSALPSKGQAPDPEDDPAGAAEYYAKQLGDKPF